MIPSMYRRDILEAAAESAAVTAFLTNHIDEGADLPIESRHELVKAYEDHGVKPDSYIMSGRGLSYMLEEFVAEMEELHEHYYEEDMYPIEAGHPLIADDGEDEE